MLRGCVFESTVAGKLMVDEIERKIKLLTQKIASIEDIEAIHVLPHLKATAEIYPLAVKLREMAETDKVVCVENMLKEVNSILKKLVEETGYPEKEFGSLEIISSDY